MDAANANHATDDDLASLYEEMPCGCMSIGRDGVIVRVNQTFLNWTGYTREELLHTKRFTDLLGVPGRIFYSTQLSPMLQMQGTVKEVAFDLNCRGRPALSVLLNAAVKKDASGRTTLTRITIFDATQRRRYERDLLQGAKNVERLTAVIASSGDAVFTVNVEGLVDSWNGGAERVFGTSAAAALGQPSVGIVRPLQPDVLRAVMERVRQKMATEAFELQIARADGRELCLAMTVSVVRDAMERVTGLSAIARDITDRREAQERLLHASLHDSLTELPNRLLFGDRVARCIDRARQDPAFHFAVLFLDLDRFKFINDSLGHGVGDQLLISVAKQLRECIEASAPDAGRIGQTGHVVARLGGDEFAVLLEALPTPNEAVRIAAQVGEALNRTHAFAGHETFVSASIGVAVGSSSYGTAEEILRDADAALHRAKANGKACYAVFDAEMHRSAVAHLTLENNLRRALARNELLLHYQPLITLADRRPYGFEALVRWRCNGGLISPGQFIPIAEDMGLIVPIGRWVLEEACRQLAGWQAQHPNAAELTMAVNISRKQLADPQLVPHLERCIAQFGVRPQSLKLEITESVIMERADEATQDVLGRIKATGAMLAMDDFGTGYSSLSCLHKFPIDVLKLDQSFVADMGKKRGAAAVVAGVVNLAHDLGLSVVAEGLEKPEQVAFLQSLKCDIGQGYIFSKPLPADAAEQFITNLPLLALSA